jgi:hypothetical protein
MRIHPQSAAFFASKKYPSGEFSVSIDFLREDGDSKISRFNAGTFCPRPRRLAAPDPARETRTGPARQTPTADKLFFPHKKTPKKQQKPF